FTLEQTFYFLVPPYLHFINRPEMLKQAALTCCKLYISESRNSKALEAIGNAAKGHPHAALLNVFEDKDYNRVGYTLVSFLEQGKGTSISSPLQETVLGMATAALEGINLEGHSGNHPRLGVVDHICFHPLGESSLKQVASLACSVAAEIATALKVPTFLYGAAHHENRSLDAIRRELGYFKPNREGQWVGLASVPWSLSPEYGPSQVESRMGVVVVGACPWVVNYNVPIVSNDLVVGRRIARKIGARGGGLPGVQAMALLHGNKGMEIACNLLDAKNVGPDTVQEEVTLIAAKEGLTAEQGYLTDYTEEQILETAFQRMKLIKGNNSANRSDEE
ncbi:hypothetical protein KI387_014006, partial [Taxus chinensis]